MSLCHKVRLAEIDMEPPQKKTCQPTVECIDNLQLSVPSRSASATMRHLTQGHPVSSTHTWWLSEIRVQRPCYCSLLQDTPMDTICCRAPSQVSWGLGGSTWNFDFLLCLVLLLSTSCHKCWFFKNILHLKLLPRVSFQRTNPENTYKISFRGHKKAAQPCGPNSYVIHHLLHQCLSLSSHWNLIGVGIEGFPMTSWWRTKSELCSQMGSSVCQWSW